MDCSPSMPVQVISAQLHHVPGTDEFMARVMSKTSHKTQKTTGSALVTICDEVVDM